MGKSRDGPDSAGAKRSHVRAGVPPGQRKRPHTSSTQPLSLRLIWFGSLTFDGTGRKPLGQRKRQYISLKNMCESKNANSHAQKIGFYLYHRELKIP